MTIERTVVHLSALDLSPCVTVTVENACEYPRVLLMH